MLIGILAMGATSHFVTANFALGLANLNNRDFVIERWHTVLVAWCVALSTLVFNTFFSRLLNKTSQGFLIL
jgi:choline transport protein